MPDAAPVARADFDTPDDVPVLLVLSRMHSVKGIDTMLQALTQINEMTLVFIPKLLGICAVLALLGSFMLGTLEDYSRTIFDQVIVVGRT